MNNNRKHIIAIAAASLLMATSAMALDGTWRGKLSVGVIKIPLIFHFSESVSGNTECTIDSPSQGATAIPATVEFCTSDSVSLECHPIDASFRARISDGRISGRFSQSGVSFPLNLKADENPGAHRPQTPRPPFPYTAIDTTFAAPDGAVMSATLTLPAQYGSGKVPAVVMISGSGAQNRDEELFEHKPFAVIADYLARNGIASLRYDDRGTGKSTGDFRTGTTYTFKDDAKSALRFMRSLPGIGRTGALGHSEGGTIAFMLGSERQTDFIVSLAGMAVSGKETLLSQNSRALDKSGVADTDKENSLKLLSAIFDQMAAQSRKGAFVPIDVDSIAAAECLVVPPAVMASVRASQKNRTAWLDTFLAIDPAGDLSRIKCPLLAINGDKDTQVDAKSNLAVIARLVRKAEAVAMPSLNHLMQHADTGEVAEYGEIHETISPDVLELIIEFIRQLK
ncbi:MAG: alpha/beta hydrolase [Muribaculaceae bacterium]|nr:alpha/beta hydrolase [Muribaculaceae bacterium]